MDSLKTDPLLYIHPDFCSSAHTLFFFFFWTLSCNHLKLFFSSMLTIDLRIHNGRVHYCNCIIKPAIFSYSIFISFFSHEQNFTMIKQCASATESLPSFHKSLKLYSIFVQRKFIFYVSLVTAV